MRRAGIVCRERVEVRPCGDFSLVRRSLSRRSRRRGSLYLEGFIVVLLAGTFLAILVPHFVRARAVARRTACLNNLKNLSLGLLNYCELHETFPPGYIARGVSPDAPAAEEHGPGWGWGAMMLPNIDQQFVFRTFDFSADVPGVTTKISIFTCPDDDVPPFTVTSETGGLIPLAPSSFVGVAGRGSLTERPGNPSKPGMFYRNSNVRLDDVRDGISNTLLLGERRSFVERPSGRIIDISSTWVGAVSGVFRDPGYVGEQGLEGPGSLTLGIVGQGDPIPLKIPPDCPPEGLGFSSMHDAGVHFARADGSCSLMNKEIDIDLFMRLGQRADGEPASWP
jgi:hypothetical protein